MAEMRSNVTMARYSGFSCNICAVGNIMSAFEHGDDTLIEQLIKSKVSLREICIKWDLYDADDLPDIDRLRTYCKRKGISIPNERPDKNNCREKRQAVERGEHKSPTVNRIVELNKAKKTVEEIAAETGKTKLYVQRIVDIFCKKDNLSRHRTRYHAVNKFATDFNLPITHAAKLLGMTYGAYQYSARVLGHQKTNKPSN